MTLFEIYLDERISGLRRLMVKSRRMSRNVGSGLKKVRDKVFGVGKGVSDTAKNVKKTTDNIAATTKNVENASKNVELVTQNAKEVTDRVNKASKIIGKVAVGALVLSGAAFASAVTVFVTNRIKMKKYSVCYKLKGLNRDQCMMQAYDENIKILKKYKNMCGKTENKELCVDKLNVILERLENEKLKYYKKSLNRKL